MELLILLLSAHFIADFYVQPTSWITCRNTHHAHSKGLWKHCFVHFVLYVAVFIISDLSMFNTLIAALAITLTHFVADWWKSYRADKLSYFVIDQCIHIAVLVIVWLVLSSISITDIQLFFKQLISPQHLLIAMAYILVCKPASIVISLALKKHTQHITNTNVGLVSAGAWIGYLERILTLSFMFMGQFAGIGFLVATKTIFRFGDLTKSTDMKLTEYMMLGTLLSYAIALFIGWNTMELYKVLN